MAQIDISQVAFAGFGLVRRKPMAVVGWALFLFVVGVLPVLAFVGPMANAYSEFFRMAAANPDPDPEKMMEMMGPMYGAQPILWLTGLITRVVLTGAIFRAILEPSASGWAYLRLGMGEVMMAVVVFVLGILVGVGMGVGGVLIFVLCLAIWQASHAVAVGVGILLGLALLLALIWVLLRFSLAAPMSFADKNFRLFESWRVTKGNSLRLLLVALILWAILMVAEMLLFGVFFAVAAPMVGMSHAAGALSQASIEAFFNQPVQAWLPQAMPWIAGVGLVGSFIGAAVMAVFTAPWAEAYRQLRKAPEAVL